jgi:pyridoxal phosphate enzyme (YggS family)
MTGNISENLLNIHDRIAKAARRAGRDPNEVTLIAVTKTVEPKRIKEAISAGIRVFGENYVQEAQEKMAKFKDKKLKWHFIGHLQKNKAKFAVELFDLIHSVDSVELAQELNKRAKEPVDILIEVNIAKENTKTGIDPEGAVKLARAISAMQNLKLRGLMAIPPSFEQAEMARPYFAMVRRLAERINKEKFAGVYLRELSMGMSNDYEVAIEEGATMVRLGTAIFGTRAVSEKKTAKSA